MYQYLIVFFQGTALDQHLKNKEKSKIVNNMANEELLLQMDEIKEKLEKVEGQL